MKNKEPKSKPQTHTEGPWILDPVWKLIMGPEGQEIAAIHAAEGPSTNRVNPGIAEANARLIAASPLMLNVLKETYDLLASKESLSSEAAELWAKISDTIQAATGGQYNAEG